MSLLRLLEDVDEKSAAESLIGGGDDENLDVFTKNDVNTLYYVIKYASRWCIYDSINLWVGENEDINFEN